MVTGRQVRSARSRHNAAEIRGTAHRLAGGAERCVCVQEGETGKWTLYRIGITSSSSILPLAPVAGLSAEGVCLSAWCGLVLPCSLVWHE
jgi:hypothetical protein